MSGRRSETPERRGWNAQGRDTAPTPLPPTSSPPPPSPTPPVRSPPAPENPGSWAERSRSVLDWAAGRSGGEAGAFSPPPPSAPVLVPAPSSLGGVPDDGLPAVWSGSGVAGAGWVSSAGAVGSASGAGLPLVSLAGSASGVGASGAPAAWAGPFGLPAGFSVVEPFPLSPGGSDTAPPSFEASQFATTQGESPQAAWANPPGAPHAVSPSGLAVAPPSPEEIAAAPVDRQMGECPICLESIGENSHGMNFPFELECCHNFMHLGCLASFGRNMSQFNCAYCRRGMQHLNWNRYFQDCVREGVEPVPAAETADAGSTIRGARADYVTRTFSSRDAPEPPCPGHILVTCCPRAHGGREVEWSPIAVRAEHPAGGSHIARFVPHWLCSACDSGSGASEIACPDAIPNCILCGVRQAWEYDAREQRGMWTCQPSCASLVQEITSPFVSVASSPALPPPSSVAAMQIDTVTHEGQSIDWTSAMPPNDPLLARTNSAVYVPLLLDATGALSAQAAEAWRAHRTTGGYWNYLVTTLRERPPVEPAFFADVLGRLIRTEIEAVERLPSQARNVRRTRFAPDLRFADSFRREAGRLSAGSRIFLNWLVQLARSGNNYIPAMAQEAILITFLGEEGAGHVAILANTLRSQGHAAVPPQAHFAQDNVSAPEASPPDPPRIGTDEDEQDDRTHTPVTDSDDDDSVPGSSEFGGNDVHPSAPDETDDDLPRLGAPSQATLRRAMSSLDAVDLSVLFRSRAFVLQGVPGFARGQFRAVWRFCFKQVLQNRGSDEQGRVRAWKLLLLVSRMLLWKEPGQQQVPREDLAERFRKFWSGQWTLLLDESSASTRGVRPRRQEQNQQQQAERANALVHLGELSAARQVLTSSGLAPGDASTLAELTDPVRRPQQLHVPLSDEVMNAPAVHCSLNRNTLRANLSKSRKGAAPGPSGTTAEHVRVLLDDEADFKFFVRICDLVVNVEMPAVIQEAMALGRMTALKKPQGGVRGIVCGDLLRRIVARTLAQQLGPEIEAACAPFQFALSTRAGTESVAHALQACTALDPNLTILSIDGISAFDSISRASMLEGLSRLPAASSALSFVKCFYGRDSHYLWTDDENTTHSIWQAAGGEQGDPLMPQLYALGQHPALVELQSHLREGEQIFACLDDVYITCQPERVRDLHDLLETCLWEHARIRINLGKTKIWNRGGIRPPNCEHMRDAEGVSAWRGDPNLPDHRRGLKILGTPLGHPNYIRTQLEGIADEHARFLNRIPDLPELQTAWLLLSYCAASRANYYLRALPPSNSRFFANLNDENLRACLGRLVGIGLDADSSAAAVAQLPFRLGGLGLRNAVRVSPAAFWASWADTLEMIRIRCPAIGNSILEALAHPAEAPELFQELDQCKRLLENEGFALAPAWQDLAHGARPPVPEQIEPGEWRHGWQFHAASSREAIYRDRDLLPTLPHSQQALLRSQGGPGAGTALTSVPYSSLTSFSCQCFRVILLRRLRLPLPASERVCRCGRSLDNLGDHRAACPHAGILASRGFALEAAAARICREAGARVVTNCFVRDLNLDGIPDDGRRLEVVANNLPLWNGAQIAVDTTLVSPLTRNGTPAENSHAFDGRALRRAERRKARTYPELHIANARVKFIVLAIEIGGRWNKAGLDFLRDLAAAKARSAPAAQRPSVAASWYRRWMSIMACAAQRALAISLLSLPASSGHCLDGHTPFLGDLLAEDRFTDGPAVSRMA